MKWWIPGRSPVDNLDSGKEDDCLGKFKPENLRSVNYYKRMLGVGFARGP